MLTEIVRHFTDDHNLTMCIETNNSTCAFSSRHEFHSFELSRATNAKEKKKKKSERHRSDKSISVFHFCQTSIRRLKKVCPKALILTLFSFFD